MSCKTRIRIVREEITILRKEKPENQIQLTDSIELTYKRVWETQLEKIDKILTVPKEKPNNGIKSVDKFSI